MGSYSNTTLANTIDKVWDTKLEDARYATSVIMPRVLNKSDKVRKSGDTVVINVKQKLTVGTVGAGGAFTPQTTTPQLVNIVVDTWKYCSSEVDGQADAQSFWDPNSDFPTDAADALSEVYDTSLGALHSNLTSNVVGGEATPEDFDDQAARASVLKLRDRNIPIDALSFILPPRAFYLGLFNNSNLTNANTMGVPKNVLTTNFRFQLLNVPCYESTLLTTVGSSIKGLLLHRSCLGIAMQKDHDYKRAEGTAAGKFSYIVAMQSLYGVKTIREDHGVVINIKSS